MYNLLAQHHHDSVDETRGDQSGHLGTVIRNICGPELVAAVMTYLRGGLNFSDHPLPLTETKADELRSALVNSALVAGSVSDYSSSIAYADILSAMVDHRNLLQSKICTKEGVVNGINKIYDLCVRAGVLSENEAAALNIRALQNVDNHIGENPLIDPLSQKILYPQSYKHLSKERLVIGNPTIPYNMPGKPTEMGKNTHAMETRSKTKAKSKAKDGCPANCGTCTQCPSSAVYALTETYASTDAKEVVSKKKSPKVKTKAKKGKGRIQRHARNVVVGSYSPSTSSADLTSSYSYTIT